MEADEIDITPPPPPSVAPPSAAVSCTLNQSVVLNNSGPIKLTFKRRSADFQSKGDKIREMEKAAAEAFLPKVHYIQCPHKKCSEEVERAEKTKASRCSKCDTLFCGACGEKKIPKLKSVHGGLSCMGFQAFKRGMVNDITDFYYCADCRSFSSGSNCDKCRLALSETRISGSSVDITLDPNLSISSEVPLIEVCEDEYPETEFVSVYVDDGNYILDLSRYTFKVKSIFAGSYLAVLPYIGTFFVVPKPLRMTATHESSIGTYYGNFKVNLGPKPIKKAHLYLYFVLYSKEKMMAVSDVFPIFVNRTWQGVTKEKQRKFALPRDIEETPEEVTVISEEPEMPKFSVEQFITFNDYFGITDSNWKISWQLKIRYYFLPEYQEVVARFLILTSSSFLVYFFSHFEGRKSHVDEGEENTILFGQLLKEWRNAVEAHPQAEKLIQLHELWSKFVIDHEKIKNLRTELNLVEPTIQYHKSRPLKKSRKESN